MLDPSVMPVMVDYNMSQITPHIFITAENTARQFTHIFAHGITCVINLGYELPYIVFPPQSGIESIKYPIEDLPTFPASQYFDAVADRIALNVASNRRTLLYCHHGRSRSVTFLLAYLIKYHGLPLPTAYFFVKERRQLALPNVGFWSQLRSYEMDQQKFPQLEANMNRKHERPSRPRERVQHRVPNGLERFLSEVPILKSLVKNGQSASTHYKIGNPYRVAQRRSSINTHSYDYRFSSRPYNETYN